MNRKLVLKFDKELLLFLTIVYYTSKLLWDNLVPYVFTFGFIGICLLFTLKYIRRIRATSDLLILLYMLVFSLYIVINAVFKDDSTQLVRAIYEYIVYALPFFLVLYCLPSVNVKSLCEKTEKWGVIIALLSWYEYITRTHLLNIHSSSGILYGGDYAFRATVFARSALAQGVIVGFFSIVAFSLFIYYRRRTHLFLSIFFYISILTTSSRGPLVSTTVALAAIYIIKISIIDKSSWKKILSSILIIAIFLLVYYILTSDFRTSNETINYFLLRIRNIINWNSDAGNLGRISRWRWSITLFESNPWFGIGPSKTGSWGAASLGVTESGILKRLCELGIIGFTMHYAFVIVIVVSGLKSMRMHDESAYVNPLLYFGSIFLILTNDFILQSTEEPSVCFIMWFALAGIVYIRDRIRNENE